MKKLTEILKKPLALIIGGLAVTIVISLLVATLFILPQVSDWNKAQETVVTTQSKVDSLTKNINLVRQSSGTDLEGFSELLSLFYPEEGDHLHFATLNESLAANFGVEVTSVAISAAKPLIAAASTPSVGPAAGAGVASLASSSTSSKSSPQPTTKASSSEIYLQISYRGTYSAIEAVLSKLESLDRAAGVSKVTANQVASTGEVTVNVVYVLPLSSKGLNTASAESVASLSKADKDLLENIEKKIEFSANPSNFPLGKADPFQ